MLFTFAIYFYSFNFSFRTVGGASKFSGCTQIIPSESSIILQGIHSCYYFFSFTVDVSETKNAAMARYT